jgi:mannose-6-phosphate isomerase-like protein (cupin superfamily)
MFNFVDYCGELLMPVIPAPVECTHDLGDARFTSLATPKTGATDTAVWIVDIAPDAPAAPHSLTREEVFVVLEGRAAVKIGDSTDEAAQGDAILVPAGVDFELSNAGPEPLRLVCCFPVGGQARLANGSSFTPPWAE